MNRASQAVAAVDTSVAVPLVLDAHEHHQEVVAALSRRQVAIAGHAAIETYAVLTRLPAAARVAAADAVTLLEASFVETVELSGPDHRALLRELASLDVGGGATYDGLVAAAARSAGLPLITRDRRAMPTYAVLGVEVELVGV